MMLNPAVWRDVPVFLTGHTGFKGGWLALWLAQLGARVHGYALAPATQPNLFALADVAPTLASHTLGDVRDPHALSAALNQAQPQVVFHLAAQPLVRESYRQPADTWATNVMGTVHLLEAVRHCPSVKAVVVITTDKCYENREWDWGYRETDPLGGHDPYSASKAGTELVVASYRQSFLAEAGVALASARAGNVIGGGDFSADRLLPDAVRALAAGQALQIRHPQATRPWQHVLACLDGYLGLAQGLLQGRRELAQAFNFGPPPEDNLAVQTVLQGLQAHWPALQWQVAADTGPHEAACLYLDSSKSRRHTGWKPKWPLKTALQHTAAWYQGWQAGAQLPALTQAQIQAYMDSP